MSGITIVPTVWAAAVVSGPGGRMRSSGAYFGTVHRRGMEMRMKCGATYKVKIVGPKGEESEFDAPDDRYILESAEEAGQELPYSCRAGACSTCAGKIVSGSVNQTDGSYLDETQMEKGYLLTCVSYPTSHLVIHTHKEAELY